jgi:Tfp pilus assembly protein PilV
MKQKGTTFIEIMVSLFLFAILILGTSQLIIYTLNVQNRCQNRLISLELASNKIETLKSMPFDHFKLKQGSWKEEIIREENKKPFLLTVEIKDVSPDIKSIVVSVSAQNKNEKKIILPVYISRKIGF